MSIFSKNFKSFQPNILVDTRVFVGVLGASQRGGIQNRVATVSMTPIPELTTYKENGHIHKENGRIHKMTRRYTKKLDVINFNTNQVTFVS